MFTYKMGDNVTEVAVKGEKVAIKEADGWKTADQMNDGGDNGGGGGFGRGNRNQFMLRRAQQAKLPVVEVQELLDRVKDLKWDRDGFVGQLSPEALRQTFSPRGGRGGGDGGDRPGPDLSNIKGSVKFWARSGMIWKYETRIEGKMSFGRDGREFDISRTTLVEVKDIGSTRLNVPVEIRRKLTTG